MNIVVQAINLTKTYSRQNDFFERFWKKDKPKITTALNKINLEVRSGEIFGVFGPNGSGKTTLLNILATLIAPTSGEAYICKNSLTQNEIKVKNLIGFAGANYRNFYLVLTGRENLRYFAALYKLHGARKKDRIAEIAHLLQIEEYMDIPFYKYASGIMQRFCLARSLLCMPRVLLLDEPTQSLDRRSADFFLEFMTEKLVKERKITVLFTTHSYREARLLADRWILLDRGTLVKRGDRLELEQIKDEI